VVSLAYISIYREAEAESRDSRIATLEDKVEKQCRQIGDLLSSCLKLKALLERSLSRYSVYLLY
jgi:cell division protein FtsL